MSSSWLCRGNRSACLLTLSLGLLYVWNYSNTILSAHHFSWPSSPPADQLSTERTIQRLAPLRTVPAHLKRRGPTGDFSQATALTPSNLAKVKLPPNLGSVFQDEWRSREFLVEFSDVAIEFGGKEEVIKMQQDTFVAYIRKHNCTGKVSRRFSRTLNLLELSIHNPEELMTVRSAPGVIYVWEPVRESYAGRED